MTTEWSDDQGRFVDIGGRRLFAAGAGQGAPPVVFDGSRRRWGGVTQRTAEFATVVVYDRANLGRSDPAPPGRTARDCVADLRALLRALGVPPPSVVVGHSIWGAHAQFQASEVPEEVAGLVLIDPMHEDGSDQIRALLPPEAAVVFAGLLARGGWIAAGLAARTRRGAGLRWP